MKYYNLARWVLGYNIHPQISFNLLYDPILKVQAVVQEATIDAGKVPLYLRVDFLVDKQGLLGHLGLGVGK